MLATKIVRVSADQQSCCSVSTASPTSRLPWDSCLPWSVEGLLPMVERRSCYTRGERTTVRIYGLSNCSAVRCSAANRKSVVDFLLDKPMNFYRLLFGSVFGSVRYRPDIRPEVDVQMFCRSVVVVQARRRCSVVVVVLLYYPELPGLCSTRSARHASAITTEGLSIYTISGGRGLGFLPKNCCGRR